MNMDQIGRKDGKGPLHAKKLLEQDLYNKKELRASFYQIFLKFTF